MIGRRLWDLGLLAPHQAGLVELASPFLHDLYGATLATVHLAVREDTEVLYVDRLRGSTSVPIVSTVGSRLPMHATGVGKVLLAFAPADVQRAVLADLPRVTAYTITQPGTLQRQLAAVRRDDYATTVEEMSLGACSVAVPIRLSPVARRRRGRRGPRASSCRASSATGRGWSPRSRSRLAGSGEPSPDAGLTRSRGSSLPARAEGSSPRMYPTPIAGRNAG